MKVMIVGAWEQPMYEKAIADHMKLLGHILVKVSWRKYFQSIAGKFETKYGLYGPISYVFNKHLLTVAYREKPDIVLIWRGTQIVPNTLRLLRTQGVKSIAAYNHDDFSGPEYGAPVPNAHKRLWRHFLKCAPLIDIHFVKRQSNIDHLTLLGAHAAEIMPMWFDPRIHRPIKLSSEELKKFACEVVFVGHYEPDGREKSVHALVNAGVNLKIWGGHYWSRKVLGDLYDNLQPIIPAEGDDYAKALCGAKVCLAFLSKLNRDTYTRRCFEIPACGRVMLAERTDDLMQMFKEDEEACFFSSNEELVQKVRWLLDNPKEREQIAQAGMRRVWTDGHDVNSRAQEFITKLNLTTI